MLESRPSLLPALASALILALGVGCTSGGGSSPASASSSSSSSADRRPIGGEPLGVKPPADTANVVMNAREMHELARRSVELLALFSSNDPKDWARARHDLRIIGDPFVPKDVEALMRITEGSDANKAAMARLELGRRAKIARTLQKLGSARYEDWQAARYEILRMGQDTVPFLVSALILEFRGPQQARYEWARQELVALGAPSISYLEAFLLAADSDVVLKDQCAITLCAIGPPGHPALAKAAASEHKWTRVATAKAIGIAQAPALLDTLRHLLLNDAAWEVRAEAAVAAGRLKHAGGVQPLLQALQDQDPLVRRQACKALGAIGAVEAVPGLIAVLEQEPEANSDHAAAALGALVKITGRKLGPDPAAWKKWYASQGGR